MEDEDKSDNTLNEVDDDGLINSTIRLKWTIIVAFTFVPILAFMIGRMWTESQMKHGNATDWVFATVVVIWCALVLSTYSGLDSMVRAAKHYRYFLHKTDEILVRSLKNSFSMAEHISDLEKYLDTEEPSNKNEHEE